METPPPYIPPQRPKSSNAVVWWVVGGISLCCVIPGLVVGGFSYWAVNKFKGYAGCILAYADMQKAVNKYTAEHGGKLPHADKWQDELREDYRASMTPANQRGPFTEPSADGDWGCVDSECGMSGMAFNSDLSGKKVSDIGNQVSTIMIFETEHPSKNQHEKYKPRTYETSPIIVGSTRRGWMELPVSGDPLMVGRNGMKVPLKTKQQGLSFEVNTKTGKDDQ